MPHFFINSAQIKDYTIVISDEQNYNHIVKSLRTRVGENLLLIDENRIQYETIVKSISNKEVIVEIRNKYLSSRNLDFELCLAQSILKSDAQSLIVEKATELGIRTLYPIITDNCSVKKDFAQKKVEKWQKIMFEASKQCERSDIPKCHNLSSLDNLIKQEKFNKIIVFCERIANKTIRQLFIETPIKKGERVLVIIGPEGGFSQREFNYFKEQKFEMLTLGSLILKAETAVIVALGNIIYEYTNFDKK